LSRVIIFGGYGVFGSQVARLLAAEGTPLTIAGRDLRQAESCTRNLGGDCRARSVDITRPDSCRAVLEGHAVAVNCAGPFRGFDSTLLEACLDVGCHYTDIADDRGYAALVRSFDERFLARGLAAVYGCSSLPGISGSLALLALAASNSPVERVRVALFIGNRNPKGQAAIHSLLAGLGRPIVAPQGTLLGFHDREVVPLPAPFGKRAVFNFEAPEYDLFPSLLGTRSVAVKVGFELRAATYAFALLARLGHGCGPREARILECAGGMLSWLGCSGGAMMAELFRSDGSIQRAALVGRHDAQRMAILPCVLAVRALLDGTVAKYGAVAVYEFLGARLLVDKMVEAGFELHFEVYRVARSANL
jgi:hypothetical protein